MSKRVIVILIVVVLFLFVVSFFAWSVLQRATTDRVCVGGCSDDPLDWIDSSSAVATIDVEEATRGASTVEGAQSIPLLGGEVAGLHYSGMYRGDVFSRSFAANGSLLMKSGSSMDPRDGVLEGLIMARVNGTLSSTPTVTQVYVFVDDDWKRDASNRLFILWSSNGQEVSSFSEKSFDFSNERDGVFVDVITGDFSWILKTKGESLGRIVVGDASLQGVQEQAPNKTLLVAS